MIPHPVRCRVQLAIGHNPESDPVGWTWTTLGQSDPGGEGRLLVNPAQTVTTGRRDESSSATPSTYRCVLRNHDGRLSPDDPESEWWPHITEGTPIRHQILTNTGWVSRFSGEITSAVTVWPYENVTGLTVLQIEAAGALRRVEQADRAIASPLTRLVTAPFNAPWLLAAWPCEDGREARSAASAVGGPPMAIGGDGDPFASAPEHPGADRLLSWRSGDVAAWQGVVPAGPTVTQWRVDWMLRLEEIPAATVTVQQVRSTGAGQLWAFGVRDDGDIVLGGRDGDGSALFFFTHPAGDIFGRWVLFSLLRTRNPSNGWSLVWVPLTGPAAGSVFGPGHQTLLGAIGRPRRVLNRTVAPAGGLSIGQMIVSTQRDLGWLAPADTGWQGEPAASRFARLTAEEQTPATVVGPTGQSPPMGRQTVEPLARLLHDTANVGGVMGEETDLPGLVYRTRQSIHNQAAAVTVPADVLANPLAPTRDDQRRTNQVTARRAGAGEVTLTDTAHQDGDGTRAGRGRLPTSIVRNLAADAQLPHHGSWALTLGTWPGARYPSLSLDLTRASDTTVADWVAAVPGDRVLIPADQLPVEHHGPADVVAEGWTETFGAKWEVTLNASPYGPWQAGVLDDGTGGVGEGRLATSGSELLAAVDDTEGTFTVGVSSGPFWTQAALHLPVALDVGGEQVDASAIGAPVAAESWVFDWDGVGDGAGGAASTNHVAPSVDAPGTADLLICVWTAAGDENTAETYTSVPGSMTEGTQTFGVWGPVIDATEILAGVGATGTRTAVFSDTEIWRATSIVLAGHDGATPQVHETLAAVRSGEPADVIQLTTDQDTQAGQWLILVHQWYADGALQPAPLEPGWEHVGSSLANNSFRLRVWARRAASGGSQTVTLQPDTDASQPGDHHARLYRASGLTLDHQTFTVTRSLNGVTKPHPAGTAVQVARPFRLPSPGALINATS